MLNLSITSDVRRLEASLVGIERQQLPFALSQALTSTAFDLRGEAVELFQTSFEVRDRNFIKTALRVDKATKRTLVAGVYDRLRREWLQMQARGGVKRPRSGANVAVPVDKIKARRGARGVPKSLRPRTVLDKPTGFVRIVGGKGLVMRRAGTKKRPTVEPMFVLTPEARIIKRYPFYETARAVVRKRLASHFRRSWRRALATAKRR